MALSSVFWAACLPVFVLVAAAVTEWAGGARAKPSLAIKPDPAFGRVLVFDPTRRRSSPMPHPAPAAARSGRVIMLHEARRQRAKSNDGSALRASR